MRKIGVLFLLGVFSISLTSALFAADEDEEHVKIKILAVNPSDAHKLTTSVVHMLPPEVQPQDVIDSQGMEIHFDKDKGSFYLTKQVDLNPKETKTMEIKIRNVWVLPTDEIAQLKASMEKKLATLQDTKYFETAKLLFEKANSRIDQIEEERRQPYGIRQQIELYRAHKNQLAEIRDGILSLDSMRQLEGNKDGSVRKAKFVITAENPANDQRKMVIRAELPSEVKSENVLDKLDFMMLFDTEKQKFVLEMQDTFAAKESKKYTIMLKDIWYIPQTELDYLRTQTLKILEFFKSTTYEGYANEGANLIYSYLDEIMKMQAEIADSDSIDERMRVFVLNNQRFSLAKRKFKELQDILLELPIKKKEETAIQKLQKGIRQIQKIQDLAKVLSMGIDPNISTTWWIIFGLMIFLAILALSFYLTWLKRMNQIIWDKKQKLGKKAA